MVIAVVGVAAAGLLMWTGDDNQSSSVSTTSSSPLPSKAVLPQSTQLAASNDQREIPLETKVKPASETPLPSSIPTALPSSTSSTALPSPVALPHSPQIEVSSDIREEPLEPEINPTSEKASSSDLATQLSNATQPLGPADVCVEMTKTILCPIIGQMPFVRDWAGQFAVWGKTSCPMGDPPT